MSVLYFFESIRTTLLDQLFTALTFFGEEILILTVICLLYWCLDKRLAYQLCFTYFLAGLGAQCLKVLCRIPRPWVLHTDFQPVDTAIPTATGYSFPSGHTQGATALYGTLGLAKWQTHASHRRLFLLGGLLLPALVGISRMYLGVHTPQDVITGYLLSLAVALPVSWYFAKRPKKDTASLSLAALLFFFSALVSIVAVYLIHTGVTNAVLASDCCKAGAAGMAFAVGWFVEKNYIRFPTTGPLAFQAAKLLLGAAGALLIKSGGKVLLGEGIPADMLRYFLLVIWVMILYPILIKAADKRMRKK
ncbi:phosphatase PAP2 family protein [Hominifimenecus sp. rT4P-3]|uniref:phosphatase PAP2 family protein n=1 Tax=Hominifimenecus sp. rT4P-3 TaxID=3242979 RepID=UPI003DA23A88